MSSAPPPPPPGSSPSGQGPGTANAAGVGVRFGARIIDGIIAGIVIGGVALVLGLSPTGITYTLLSVVAALAYYVGFETSQGWTPGKKILNLSVVGASGGNPTPEESLKRNAFLALQIVPIIGGLLGLAAAVYIAITISNADDDRGVHDHFADTAVRRG